MSKFIFRKEKKNMRKIISLILLFTLMLSTVLLPVSAQASTKISAGAPPLLMRYRQYETENDTTMFNLRVKELLRKSDSITFEKNGAKVTVPAAALNALKMVDSQKLVVSITRPDDVSVKLAVTVNGEAVSALAGTVVTMPWATATANSLTATDENGNAVDAAYDAAAKAVSFTVNAPGTYTVKIKSADPLPEEPAEGRIVYRWDFNDLTEKNGKGNLTDSERSTKGYTLQDGIITVTDRTTDFTLGESFKLTNAYDWSIEWKADLEKGSALFGSTASANNFIYLAYETASWKNPFRVVTGAGKAYMIPLGAYVSKMTEMNTWRAEFSSKDAALTLKFYNETDKVWEIVGKVAMAGDFAFEITNLFGRYKSGTDVCLKGSVDYVQVSTIREEKAETKLEDVNYRWDFNDLNGKDGKGNLTDSEKSTKGYTLQDGVITVTDRTTDFVIDGGFELADTYDWSIEWKADLEKASALFGTTASTNNFVYLAYTVGNWKNPVRMTTGDGTSYMIPLGDYMDKMTEMNTWKLSYSAKDKAMSLKFYDETAQSWEDVGSVAIPDPFSLKLTNLFGRYKAGTNVCMTGTVDYVEVVAKRTVEN